MCSGPAGVGKKVGGGVKPYAGSGLDQRPEGLGRGAVEAPESSARTSAQAQAAADVRAVLNVFMAHLLRVVDRRKRSSVLRIGVQYVAIDTPASTARRAPLEHPCFFATCLYLRSWSLAPRMIAPFDMLVNFIRTWR